MLEYDIAYLFNFLGCYLEGMPWALLTTSCTCRDLIKRAFLYSVRSRRDLSGTMFALKTGGCSLRMDNALFNAADMLMVLFEGSTLFSRGRDDGRVRFPTYEGLLEKWCSRRYKLLLS